MKNKDLMTLALTAMTASLTIHGEVSHGTNATLITDIAAVSNGHEQSIAGKLTCSENGDYRRGFAPPRHVG